MKMTFPKERLDYAIDRLREYKQAKAPLESRIKEEELWWQLRHWEVIGKPGKPMADAVVSWPGSRSGRVDASRPFGRRNR